MFKEKIKKYIANKQYQIRLKVTRWWRDVPDKRKTLYIYLANYTWNALLLSIVLVYILLWNVLFVRYVFMVPVMLITIIYVEHYYKWFRIGYKEQNE